MSHEVAAIPTEVFAALVSIRRSLGQWEGLGAERSNFPRVFLHESAANAIIAYVDTLNQRG